MSGCVKELLLRAINKIEAVICDMCHVCIACGKQVLTCDDPSRLLV